MPLQGRPWVSPWRSRGSSPAPAALPRPALLGAPDPRRGAVAPLAFSGVPTCPPPGGGGCPPLAAASAGPAPASPGTGPVPLAAPPCLSPLPTGHPGSPRRPPLGRPSRCPGGRGAARWRPSPSLGTCRRGRIRARSGTQRAFHLIRRIPRFPAPRTPPPWVCRPCYPALAPCVGPQAPFWLWQASPTPRHHAPGWVLGPCSPLWAVWPSPPTPKGAHKLSDSPRSAPRNLRLTTA